MTQNNHLSARLNSLLFQPVHPAPLGLFRIILGLLLAWQSYFIFNFNFVETELIAPATHFSYPLFSILQLPVLPPTLMHVIFRLMGVASLAIAAGLFYRWSTLIFLLTFSYFFLLEKALFNNHYYLLILLNGLLLFIPAARWASLDNLRNPNTQALAVPFWQILILRFQIIIVYLFGAIAKFNKSWLLEAQPLKTLLAQYLPIAGRYHEEAWLAYLISWGGFLFDLFIPIFLCFKKTRLLAFAGVLIFNSTNHFLFNTDIGIFPFFMMGALVLFFEPQPMPPNVRQLPEPSPRHKSFVRTFLLSYAAIQILIPIPYHFFATAQEKIFQEPRFFWTMKANLKISNFQIIFEDPTSGKKVMHNPLHFVNQTQIQHLGSDPGIAKQYLKFLQSNPPGIELNNGIIHYHSELSLNGSKPFPFYSITIYPESAKAH